MTTTTVSSGQFVTSTTVRSGNELLVQSGGAATDTTVSAGGLFEIAGGSAIFTDIVSGGSAIINAFGDVSATTVANGATMFVSGGGMDNNTLILGLEYVGEGGSSFVGSVGGGGVQIVQSGGFTSYTLVSGGEQIVSAGGSAADTFVSGGGTQLIESGGYTVSTTLISAEELVLGGRADATFVLSGGYLGVSGGFALSATALDGGVINVTFGVTSASVVADGGFEGLYDGEAFTTSIGAGGEQYVGQSSYAFSSFIGSGGIEVVGRDGIDVDATVSAGGTLAGIDPSFPLDPSFISNATIQSGGMLVISGVGFAGYELGAQFTTIEAGGTFDLGGDAYRAGAFALLNTATDVLTTIGDTDNVTIQLAGSYTNEYFALSTDHNGGTDIVVETGTPCFCRGTLIQTDRGDIAVEDLAIGDNLIVKSGESRSLQWIGHRAYSGRFAAGNKDVLPIRLSAGSLGGGAPARDLLVSPLHAFYLDGVLVPAWLLANGTTITQLAAVDQVEYFHLELPTHDVIIAEGALAETYVEDDNRGMFHNAADHAARHPTHRPARAIYCAPRVEHGPQLELIRARLSPPVHTAPNARALRGCLDEASRAELQGWARDGDAPTEIEILVDGAPTGRITANRYRADLAQHGLGDGRHAFSHRFDPPLSNASHAITLRRTLDGAILPGTPTVLEAADSFDTLAPQLDAAVTATDPADRARVLDYLLAQAQRLRPTRPTTTPDRPRALIIDRDLPDPNRDAGSQAILSHMAALQALGFAVSFVAAEQMQARTPILAARGITHLAAPHYQSVEDILRQHQAGFELIYLHRVSMAEAYLALARRHAPRARILFSVADLHHLRLARLAEAEQRPELLAPSRRLRLAECTAAWQADAVLTHSPTEAALLRQLVPQAQIHVVPWAVELTPNPTPDARRAGLAFIGNYAHAPNVDAARILLDEIMPQVWATRPDIELRLIGANLPPILRAVTTPNVILCGQVENLTQLLHATRLTVAPLRAGAGIKGKLLVSLAAGVPCLTTPIGAEGLALPAQLIAEDMAASVLRLYDDADAYAALAAAGRHMVATTFSAEATRAALADVLGATHAALQAAG